MSPQSNDQPSPDIAQRIVVLGVAGAGKTTVGVGLARHLGISFLDADDLHSAYCIEKMSSGVALTDDDRRPWLDSVRSELSRSSGIVVSCSALKKRYRDVLRTAGSVRFLFLDLDPTEARARCRKRRGHFMPHDLVLSQFRDLEVPEGSEPDVRTIFAGGEAREVLDAAIDVMTWEN